MRIVPVKLGERLHSGMMSMLTRVDEGLQTSNDMGKLPGGRPVSSSESSIQQAGLFFISCGHRWYKPAGHDLVIRKVLRKSMNIKRIRGRHHRPNGGMSVRQSSNQTPVNRNHVFDSNGPEMRVRGTAQQLFEKYLQLGRDATGSGDRILAEGYFQHAEHYFRITNVMAQAAQQSQAERQERHQKRLKAQQAELEDERRNDDASEQQDDTDTDRTMNEASE